MKTCSMAICIVAAVICSACDVHQIAGTFNDLQQVQRTVSKAVGTDNVTVNLNNGQYLTIGLVNTPLKNLSSDQRRAKALEVAKLGYRSYPSIPKLSEIRVVFVVQHSYLGVFNYTDATDAFSFSKSELSSIEHTAQ